MRTVWLILCSTEPVPVRLQTLAAVYGLTIYVPPATTRQTSAPELLAEVLQKLGESDVVLAVMMHSQPEKWASRRIRTVPRSALVRKAGALTTARHIEVKRALGYALA